MMEILPDLRHECGRVEASWVTFLIGWKSAVDMEWRHESFVIVGPVFPALAPFTCRGMREK